MAQINVNLSELQVLSGQLDAAVDDFDRSYKKIAGSIMEYTDDCNSDFIMELEKILRAFKNDRAKKAVEAAKNCANDVSGICKTWELTDKTIEKRIHEGKEKKC